MAAPDRQSDLRPETRGPSGPAAASRVRPAGPREAGLRPNRAAELSSVNVEAVRSDRALYLLDRGSGRLPGSSTNRVLQLIVDSVRDLVSARYAALGTFDDLGRIESFITSGISDDLRALIGPLPRSQASSNDVRDGATLRIPTSPGIRSRTTSAPARPIVAGRAHPGRRDDRRGLPDREGRRGRVRGGRPGSRGDVRRPRRDRLLQHFGCSRRSRTSRSSASGTPDRHAAASTGSSRKRLRGPSLSLEDAVETIESNPVGPASRVRSGHRSGSPRSPTSGRSSSGSDPGPKNRSWPTPWSSWRATCSGASTVVSRPSWPVRRALSQVLSPEGVLEIVQIAREAVSNIARHSGAARLVLRLEGGRAGGDAHHLGRRRRLRRWARLGSGHFRLANLRDRAAALAGTLSIGRARGDAHIIVRFPLAPPESHR